MVSTQQEFNELQSALSAHCTVPELKKLASNLKLSYPPTRKADLVETICTHMRTRLPGIVERLSDVEQSALSEIVHSWDGKFFEDTFEAKYGASLPDNKKNVLQLFLVKGQVPHDLLTRLKQILPVPEEDTLTTLETDMPDDLIVRETEHAALNNLNTLLRMVRDKQVRVSGTTKKPTAATIKKFTALLHDGDWYEDASKYPAMQGFAWPLLIQAGGLAKLDGTLLKLTRNGTKLLSGDLPKGIRTIWERWENKGLIDEFSRVTEIKGQRGVRGRVMTAPARRRPDLNGVLEELEPEKWISVDEISRYMRSASIELPMTNYDWKLYIVDSNYGHLDYYDTWPLLQLRYMLVYFFEYCATLGLIDVAYTHPEDARKDFKECWGSEDMPYLSPYDGLKYIRLNELGAYVFQQTETYEGSADQAGAVLEGTRIICKDLENLPVNTDLFLNKIAKLTGKGQWTLSPSTLASGIQDGITLPDIVSNLSLLVDIPARSEMDILFKKMAEQSNILQALGTARLFACSTALQRKIMADRKIASLCLAAGKEHIVVLPGREAEFIKALEGMQCRVAGGKKNRIVTPPLPFIS